MIRTALPFLLCLAAWSQPAFEVASVQPSPPPKGNGITVGCGGGPGTTDPGIVNCKNVTLALLLPMAYRMSLDQIAAPSWIDGQRFDITARVPAGTTREQMANLWQKLLIDRFKLAVHRESRVVAQYDLLVDRGGPKFKPPEQSPDPNVDQERHSGPTKLDKDGFPILNRPGMIGEKGHLRLYQTKMTMEQLARTAAGQLGRPVTDRTGLEGEYEIRLSWLAEQAGKTTDADLGPTLAQALRDQLGLRLEPKKAPVEFLVVDHLEKMPTDN